MWRSAVLAALLSSVCSALPLVQFAELQWSERAYQGSSVESIDGVLVNNSNQTLSSLILSASLYTKDGTLLGDALPAIAQSVPPNGRWLFSMKMIMSTLPMGIRPAYAKISKAFCFVAGTDGLPVRLELPVPAEVIIWSPEVLKQQAAMRELQSKTETKIKQAAIQEFRKDHPCPPTNKTKGACKGYYVDYVIELQDGGLNSSSNLEWKDHTHRPVRP